MKPGAWRAVLCLVAAPRLASPAAAQADPWQRQVQARLDRVAIALAREGYTAGSESRSGALFAEESGTLSLPLEAGRAYAIAGVCDDDCRHLVLVLSRGTRTEVAAVRGPGSIQVLRITPRDSAAYRLTVLMADCVVSPCRWGIALHQRRPGPPARPGRPGSPAALPAPRSPPRAPARTAGG